MTEQPREVVPILFLGQDPRFLNPGTVSPEHVEQIKQARGRDFRPGIRPADAPEVEAEEVPKDSTATEPASDSNGEVTSQSSPESPDPSADAGKDQNNPPSQDGTDGPPALL